jgi:hypothetical protein
MFKNYLSLIVNDPSFIKTVIILFFILLLIVIYNIWKKITAHKYGIKTLSWITIFENIKLTLYDDCDKEGELYVSLPRLGYMVSILLVIYCVIFNQYEMIASVVGFSITMTSAYVCKKKIESNSHNNRNSTIDSVIEKVTSMLNTNKNDIDENEINNNVE